MDLVKPITSDRHSRRIRHGWDIFFYFSVMAVVTHKIQLWRKVKSVGLYSLLAILKTRRRRSPSCAQWKENDYLDDLQRDDMEDESQLETDNSR